MDYDLIVVESFSRDYEAAANYLEYDLCNPQSAKRLAIEV